MISEINHGNHLNEAALPWQLE